MGKIIFYAPVGNNVPDYLIGGGEMGCRRTRHILGDEAGHEVITIDKAILGLGATNYIKMIIQSFIRITALLLKNRDALLYVVGFYEKNLWYEWLLISIGKLLGHKTVYEARNGRLVKAYYEYGKIYKFFMRSTLKKASLIICQGQEYVDFIVANNWNQNCVYIPNYVLNSKLRPYAHRNTNGIIQLIYFGRVVESKNIRLMIETVHFLHIKNVPVKLTLIGGYTEEFKAELDEKILKLNLPQSVVEFTGAKNFDVIADCLQKSHFFLFPSQEIKEGHSNSLTEAMAFGVVPIVSTAGFSAKIVDESCLVEEEINAEKYAEKVLFVLRNDLWEGLSHKMYDRVQKYYTQNSVNEKLIKAIRGIVDCSDNNDTRRI